MKQRIDFANAALSQLVWNSNKHCRSLAKPYGAKLERMKGEQIYKRCLKGINVYDAKTDTYKRKTFAGCEDRWNTDSNFRQRMMDQNGYDKSHMLKFDRWAKEPKAKPKPMSWKRRQERFGDQKWYLAQTQEGGQDTVPTAQYPEYLKEEAVIARAREKVKLIESKEWKQESKKEDSTSWNARYDAPSSSSTSWNQSSWQPRDWQEERYNHPRWHAPPGKKKKKLSGNVESGEI